MTQFKKGDIIVKGVNKVKVIEVLGDLVFFSQNDYTKTSGYYTHQELTDNSWKLEEREWTPEMNEEYFYPDLSSSNKYGCSDWDNDNVDNHRKNTVGVFSSPEEAITCYDEIIKLIKK